jgi:pyruvate/2-oxoglutarate/acetoin dehydrogenase E1 component
MGTYIAGLNKAIADQIAKTPSAVVYGENIDNGSYMSGLTRNWEAPAGGRIINVGDCESTHCGVGFGLMLNGVTSILVAKQLDFLLLGVEQMVSTYQNIRSHRDLNTLGGFSIISAICDHGYQGPQSSFNALGDICSMARVPGYTLTNSQDAELILKTQLNAPGFRIICLSQRLYPTEILEFQLLYNSPDCSVLQYFDGDDATIACFNCSIPEGDNLRQRLLERGKHASLFSVNQVYPTDWSHIADSVTRTGKLIVFDDSKSINLLAHTMMRYLAERCPPFQSTLVAREEDVDFGVSEDKLHVDYEQLLARSGV